MYTYAFRNLRGNCVNMGFPCDIFINKYAQNLVTVSLLRVMPSMNSSGNFAGMKRFLEVG